jgi:hypothetical protein
MAKTIEEITADFAELTEEDFTANWGELLRANPDFAKTFDRRVSKGIATAMETEETKREAAAEEAAKGDAAQLALAARGDLLDRKERALKYKADNNLDMPIEQLFTLLGLDDSDDEARLEALEDHTSATRKQETIRLLKSNGGNPHGSVSLEMTPKTVEEIAKLPESEQRQIDTSVMDLAIQNHQKKSRVSLRDRILGSSK